MLALYGHRVTTVDQKDQSLLAQSETNQRCYNVVLPVKLSAYQIQRVAVRYVLMTKYGKVWDINEVSCKLIRHDGRTKKRDPAILASADSNGSWFRYSWTESQSAGTGWAVFPCDDI